MEGIDEEERVTKQKVEDLETRAVELVKGVAAVEEKILEIEQIVTERKELRSEMEVQLRNQSSAELEYRARVDEFRAVSIKLKHSINDVQKTINDLQSDFEKLPKIDPELEDSLAGQGLIPNKESEESQQLAIKCESVAAATLVRVKREITDDVDDVQMMMESPKAAHSVNQRQAIARVMDVIWPDLSEEAIMNISQGEIDLEVYQAEELLTNFGNQDKKKGDEVLMDLTVLQRFQEKSGLYREAKRLLDSQNKVRHWRFPRNNNNDNRLWKSYVRRHRIYEDNGSLTFMMVS